VENCPRMKGNTEITGISKRWLFQYFPSFLGNSAPISDMFGYICMSIWLLPTGIYLEFYIIKQVCDLPLSKHNPWLTINMYSDIHCVFLSRIYQTLKRLTPKYDISNILNWTYFTATKPSFLQTKLWVVRTTNRANVCNAIPGVWEDQ
jgi:hypothetical protein